MNSSRQPLAPDEAGKQNLPIPQLDTQKLMTGEIVGNVAGRAMNWSGEGGNQYGMAEDHHPYQGFRNVVYTGTGNVPGINPRDYYNNVNVPQFQAQNRDLTRINTAGISDGINERNDGIVQNHNMVPIEGMMQVQNIPRNQMHMGNVGGNVGCLTNVDGRNDSLRVSNGSPAQSSIVGHRNQNTTPRLNESFSNDEDDRSRNVMTDSMVRGEDRGSVLEADLSLESENASKMRIQELMYEEESGFRVCENVKNAIRVAVNENLVKNLKFLPRSGASYRMLDFVNDKGKLVEIVNWLLEEMNYDYSWENKVRFWITYNQWIRKQVTNHRSNVSTKLKERFLKCVHKGFDAPPGTEDSQNIAKLLGLVRNGIAREEPESNVTDASSSKRKRFDGSTLLNMDGSSSETVPDLRTNTSNETPSKKGMELVREKGNENLFVYLLENCYGMPLQKHVWRRGLRTKQLHEVITVYDEALVLLLLENNLLMWQDMFLKHTLKLKDCTVKPVYTRARGKGVGWSMVGIARFNMLVKTIGLQRKEKKMETEELNFIAQYRNKKIRNKGHDVGIGLRTERLLLEEEEPMFVVPARKGKE